MSENRGAYFEDETPNGPSAVSPYEVIDLTPPVLDECTIITQPSSGTADSRADVRNQRRPIPISTQDWISTNRPQFSPISAEYFLTNVEQLEIQPIVDINALLGRSGKQFRVKVRGGETLFLATEESTKCQRTILGSSRSFLMDVRDASGERAFMLSKEMSWGCMPGFLHNMVVETTEYIGSIEQNFTLFGPSFTVYDASREAMCIIDGPNMCCCCMSKEVHFQVLSTDMSRQIASISHQYDHLLVDYILLLTFPSDANVRLKSLLLAATFLMGALYFDRLSQSATVASRSQNSVLRIRY